MVTECTVRGRTAQSLPYKVTNQLVTIRAMRMAELERGPLGC